jgi:hypothetical protein
MLLILVALYWGLVLAWRGVLWLLFQPPWSDLLNLERWPVEIARHLIIVILIALICRIAGIGL